MMVPYPHQGMGDPYTIHNPIHIERNPIEMDNRMNQSEAGLSVGINPLNVTHPTRPTSISQERRKQRRIR